MRFRKLQGTCSMVELYEVSYPQDLTKQILKEAVKKYNAKQLLKAYTIILNLNSQWYSLNNETFREKTGFKLIHKYKGYMGHSVSTYIVDIKDL